jgi:hypothetical protein
MEESASRLGEELGWSTRLTVPQLNVDESRHSYDIDEDARAEIARINELDIELYERILQNSPLTGKVEPPHSAYQPDEAEAVGRAS